MFCLSRCDEFISDRGLRHNERYLAELQFLPADAPARLFRVGLPLTDRGGGDLSGGFGRHVLYAAMFKSLQSF